MALKEVYDYFRHYDKDTYQVVACMGNEPCWRQLDKFPYHSDENNHKLP